MPTLQVPDLGSLEEVGGLSSDTSSSVPRPLTVGPEGRSPGLRPRPAGAARPGPGRPAELDLVVDCAVYVDGQRFNPTDPHDALREATERGGFVWLGLYEPSESELGTIAARYGLHPLAVEDAVFAHQRPKLDHYDDGIFMVLKTATYVEHEELTDDQRGRRHRRDHGVPRRELRDHRAARRTTAA